MVDDEPYQGLKRDLLDLLGVTDEQALGVLTDFQVGQMVRAHVHELKAGLDPSRPCAYCEGRDENEHDPLERRMECDNGCGVTLHRDSIDSTEDRWRCTKCGEITWTEEEGRDELSLQAGGGPTPVFEGPRVMIVELPEGYKDHAGYPWRDGDAVLFLGEILNMPGGHCAVVSKDGTVNWAFHTDNFREPTEDEL